MKSPIKDSSVAVEDQRTAVPASGLLPEWLVADESSALALSIIE